MGIQELDARLEELQKKIATLKWDMDQNNICIKKHYYEKLVAEFEKLKNQGNEPKVQEILK